MCEFCEMYDSAKELAEERKRLRGIDTMFEVLIRQTKKLNGMKRGTVDGRPVKLKFCPLCGKQLNTD